MENMIITDIQEGRGVTVVDPLGDLVEKIIDFIPSSRINDVIYFNPADLDYPLAFNVLESVDPAHHHLVSSGLISVFKKLWVDSWGPRLEYLLRNTILALLEYPGSTLMGVTRLLIDKKYRQKVINKINDPVVKMFWMEEYSAYSNQFRTEAISPIQNKVGQFLSSAVIRNIVGQPKSTIDLRDIMDNGKILLLNLAKGRIGEDNASLLGAMVITKIQLAAMSRIDIPEETRRDFYLYVDEFQNFATESFATILSEARKYRLNLVIAHQYIEQLDETVQAAVFGNVGTIVCFRIGAADAEALVKEFEPVFDETDLVNLTKYNVYLRLMIDGVASDPFSAITLPPLVGVSGNREKVIKVSRERYSKPRKEVEDKIIRWTGIAETFKATAKEDNRASRSRGGDNRSFRNDRPPQKRFSDDSRRPDNRNVPRATEERREERRQPSRPVREEDVLRRVKKIKNDEAKIEKVIPRPPEEISLKQVISRDQQQSQGDQRKPSQSPPPRRKFRGEQREPSQSPPQQRNLRDDQRTDRKNERPQPRSSNQRRDPNSHQNVLKPGQVVKF